jgi:hypothetical protein
MKAKHVAVILVFTINICSSRLIVMLLLTQAQTDDPHQVNHATSVTQFHRHSRKQNDGP